MKRCIKCDAIKPLEDFPIHKGKYRRGECRECNAKRTSAYSKNNLESIYVARKQRMQDHYARVNQLKSGPCSDCGKRFNPWQMDFDHVAGDKILPVSAMISRGFSIEKIESEIKKCELVCANCHRDRTHKRKQ